MSNSNKAEKDKTNTTIVSQLNQDSTEIPSHYLENKAFKRINDAFNETHALKHEARERNKEIEDQFKTLRTRLNSSSECLTRIKKNIDNLKFSYQKNVMDMNSAWEPGDCFNPEINPLQSREDMSRHLDDVRKKIEDLQSDVKRKQDKRNVVSESYKSALENVSGILNHIEQGNYSSLNVNSNEQ